MSRRKTHFTQDSRLFPAGLVNQSSLWSVDLTIPADLPRRRIYAAAGMIPNHDAINILPEDYRPVVRLAVGQPNGEADLEMEWNLRNEGDGAITTINAPTNNRFMPAHQILVRDFMGAPLVGSSHAIGPDTLQTSFKCNWGAPNFPNESEIIISCAPLRILSEGTRAVLEVKQWNNASSITQFFLFLGVLSDPL